MARIAKPTKELALKIITDNFDAVYNSKQGTDLISELYVCSIFNLEYVDAHGYDGIDRNTKSKVEIKVCNARTEGRAQFSGCGARKSPANEFIFWDKITGQYARVPNKLVQENIQGNSIKARLSDNPGGISKKIKTVSSWFSL